MSDKVYKTIELTGTSKTSMEEAVSNAVSRAHKTLRHLRWFQVTDTRGHIEDGEIVHWQVTVKIGMTIED
ncbi:dodecin family protein [Halorhodospira halochloris]|uniref:dodecin n=1 Tax=Halorhodospira halochloris TaxID=1052 RepID=UPI001EE8F390|nr:dodecin [Halorhodospira halochloris]MCG5529879.1 dodecin family protein [Halorhodospira halochloris]